MLQGTGSDVGKSLVVAGLCRAFSHRGLAVAPFKPQNMSNNAAVTEDGGEIGRAQALQARACGLPPSRHMNPVLLKPQSEVGSQVVVQGEVIGNAGARDYHALKLSLLPRVLESFRLLGEGRDLIVVEGAGSAAEINLRSCDIANMGFAEAADIPVVLIGDIDRGGVIASLVGTHALLPASERNRVKGWIINKFRGEKTLFDPAVALIEERTGWPGLGVVPWFAEASKLPAEDGAGLTTGGRADGTLHIAVPRLSRIANFDDFDPLAAEPDVDLSFVSPGQPLPRHADLIILPGSKATIADLQFLRAQGWDLDLAAHLRHGGRILGICAGYQMLGTAVSDPLGVEGPPGSVAGLGLLDVATVMTSAKTLRQVEGSGLGHPVRGYEMHMGQTEGIDRERPLLTLDGAPDGAISADGRVMGCYLHGLFAADDFRRSFLAALKPGRTGDLVYETMVDQVLDRLAEHLEAHLDMNRLLEIAQG
ncbi:cobyric acid synthase [Telmatospirillum siberiense]|uniref:Cobyric acid synthase n=1 Tax=Telmatospirillum siberiense TaxID=382514 RepID=A0A2N3PMX4_9PROT|nr:cobyric acid synthase [Telmatospirillum siberiense]PKU21756.1 cobyric acid synthase CobQ [Telmatospirillum siberiense]